MNFLKTAFVQFANLTNTKTLPLYCGKAARANIS